MKKALILSILAAAVMSFAGCNGQVQSTGDKNTNLANTNVASSADSSSADKTESSLPDKSTFEKIPDEAVDSFNSTISASKKLYPESESGKRLYGYVGDKIVNKSDCYVFVIYDVMDNVNTKVATLAKSKATSLLYVLNEETGKYNEVTVPEDDSSSELTFDWASSSVDNSSTIDMSSDKISVDEVSVSDSSSSSSAVVNN